MSGSHPRVGFICSGMWYRHQGLKIFLRYSNEQPELRLTYLDLFLVSFLPPFLLFPWFLQSFLKFFCWFLYVLNLWAPREAHMCLMSTFNSFSSFLFFSFHLLVLFCFLATPCGLWDLSSLARDWTLVKALGAWNTNHWATRGLPKWNILWCWHLALFLNF